MRTKLWVWILVGLAWVGVCLAGIALGLSLVWREVTGEKWVIDCAKSAHEQKAP